jgi:hypothetical protein
VREIPRGHAGDLETATLDVHRVWKGQIGAVNSMTTNVDRGGNCGWSFNRGQPTMVFAYREDTLLTTNYCMMRPYLSDQFLFEAHLSRMKSYAPAMDRIAPVHAPSGSR